MINISSLFPPINQWEWKQIVHANSFEWSEYKTPLSGYKVSFYVNFYYYTCVTLTTIIFFVVITFYNIIYLFNIYLL